jgi:hypothetical protein
MNAASGSLPDKMSLKPSRLRWVFVFLVGAVFSAAAAFLMEDKDPLTRWGICAFFAVVALVAIPGMIGVGSQLDLDREGFTCKTPFKTFRRKWTECSAFAPVSIGLNSFVGFSSATDEAAKPGLAAMNKSMIGASGTLPDRYGMSAGKLADLLNRFRARAMGS